MFNSGNCGIPAVMNVEPTGGGCYNSGMNGFGGDWIWILVVFALLFGWGGNGFGNNGGNGGAVPYMVGSTYTDAAIQRGFDNQSVINKLNGIEQGVCNLGYENLAQMNNLGMAVANGFHGVDNAICNLGYTTQQGFNATQVVMLQGQNALQAQLCNMSAQNQACCCETQRLLERGFADTNYNMATNTCAITNQMNNNTRDIIESQNAGTRAILDYLCQDKISTLQAENQSLKLAASQADQNAFIAANQSAQTAELIRRLGADCPVNAVVVQPNTPVTFPTNCCGGVNYAGYGNNGCGCNSGCC